MKEKLFSSSTLNKISNPDFKEDSVKEIIILPILERLGYKRENIYPQ